MSRPGPFLDVANVGFLESEKRLHSDMNENHDPKSGEFSSGESGGGGSEKSGGGGSSSGGFTQITSDEHMEYTDIASNISDKIDTFNNQAESLSNASSNLKDAVESLNNHDVNDDDGSSQETAYDYVKETASALEEFQAQAALMANSAANASKAAKDALVRFKKQMKEHGLAQ